MGGNRVERPSHLYAAEFVSRGQARKVSWSISSPRVRNVSMVQDRRVSAIRMPEILFSRNEANEQSKPSRITQRFISRCRCPQVCGLTRRRPRGWYSFRSPPRS
jgi:hypothetical protein